jgi:LmbE family N-acetylglucosaminyl deacetylase
MTDALRLMAVLAHPDDESLGYGGALAKYAAEGVRTSILTATRGQAGRFRGHRQHEALHPGRAALAAIRETELRAAAATLGVADVALLDYEDHRIGGIKAPLTEPSFSALYPRPLPPLLPPAERGQPACHAFSAGTGRRSRGMPPPILSPGSVCAGSTPKRASVCFTIDLGSPTGLPVLE